VDYVRSIAELRAYYPLTKDFTLVGRGLAGNIFNWNGGEVRTVDDFYKGGECVRGFGPAGLGPRDQQSGDALGGKNFYCATAELRFPLPFIPEDLGFGGAIFADAGSVWGTDSAALANKYLLNHSCPYGAGNCGTNPGAADDSSAVRASVGGSLIWNSPIGPLRADFGYALLKQSFDQTEVFRFGAATRF
jgi:outer membrane protein insertion porin family